MLLGERLAQAALGLVYGQPIAWQAPDLAAARRRGDRVELEFAAVESRMDSIDLEANSFRVEDATGEVPVAAVSYPQDHRVELVLKRPLQGPARVHGGYARIRRPCRRIWSAFCRCWASGAWRSSDNKRRREQNTRLYRLGAAFAY